MPLRAYGPLFGQVHGSGDPGVIALHGWRRRGADFDRVLAGVDAVAFDLPGFGATPQPASATGAAGYAEMVIEALEAIGPGPFRLIGHSFGGRVATVIAATRHDLVSSLVLTGAPLVRIAPASRAPVSYRLLRLGHRWGVVSDERMERIRRSRGSADYRAVTGVMRDVLVTVVNESYEWELSQIICPVDLVWGADDTDVPPPVAEAAKEILESVGTPVTLTVLEGVGHLTPLDAPGELRARLSGERP